MPQQRVVPPQRPRGLQMLRPHLELPLLQRHRSLPQAELRVPQPSQPQGARACEATLEQARELLARAAQYQ